MYLAHHELESNINISFIDSFGTGLVIKTAIGVKSAAHCVSGCKT